MLLHIIARGKIARSPEGELVDRYLKRVTWPTKITELPESAEKNPHKGPPEAAPATVTVLLDEKGGQLSSLELAKRLEHWRDGGTRECRFLLGGADGFGDAERKGADLLIAFGKATWPHLLARAMLAEQLWRATSIIAGHPYHREG